jgi:hypothetical protein
MTFFVIATTVLIFVVLPAAFFALCVVSASELRDPSKRRVEDDPSVLEVGKRQVLDALARKDVDAAERAFRDMVSACGHCHRLYRRRGPAPAARPSGLALEAKR